MSTNKRWTEGELLLLRQKVKEGLSCPEIQSMYLPYRTVISVQKQMTRKHSKGAIRLTIDDLQRDADSAGLILLDTEYIVGKEKYKYRCKDKTCKYESELNFQNIRSKSTGCPRCAGKVVFIDDAIEIATKYGGICDEPLQPKRISATKPLKFICKAGHRFELNYNKLKSSKRWCTECSPLISERIVRLFFEKLTGKKFPKVNVGEYDWLMGVDDNGTDLTLDGYCSELSVAFEHWGKFHWEKSKNTRFFHKSLKFEDLQLRDFLKMLLCEAEGVKLMIVPQVGEVWTLQELQLQLVTFFNENDIPYSKEVADNPIDPSSAYTVDLSVYFNEVDKIIKSKGGKRLEAFSPYRKDNIKIRCSKHGVFPISPENIYYNSWCKKCGQESTSKKLRGSIKEINERLSLKKRKFICITPEAQYVPGPRSELKFQCLVNPNHTWEREAANYVYRDNAACPDCPKTEQYKNLSKVHSKAIHCVTNGIIFSSTVAASLETGCSEGGIRHVIHGRQDTCRGWVFEFVDEELKAKAVKSREKRKRKTQTKRNKK
jgi:hypothetical protein